MSNPPFGVDWKQYRKAVEAERQIAGYTGRFGPGLPRVSDGSLLFLMHLISEMREPSATDDKQSAGRATIVLNGSPLFTGGAGSGESNIRKWVLDNNYLEAIIGLPTDMFYNTGISTYLWILSKDKAPERHGKVQLIDATDMFVKMRKSVGSKRKELSKANIEEIAHLYGAFPESKNSKILRTEDFFYRTITVERPLRLNFAFTADRIESVMASRPVAKLSDDDAAALRSALEAQSQRADREVSTNKSAFTAALLEVLAEAGVVVKPAVLKTIVSELSERDEDGELQTNRVLGPEPDSTLRDTENVPWDQDVHEYLEREVKPFVPDAWIDESKIKEGAEIPFTRHFYEYVPPRTFHVDAPVGLGVGFSRATALR